MEVPTIISMNTTNSPAVVQNMDNRSMLNGHGLCGRLKSNNCTFMHDQNCPCPQLFFSSVLSVLGTKYHDNVANNIQNILPQHKVQIKYIKEDGFSIVVYCRESDLEKQDNIVNLLQRMVDNHYSRSLADKVFVSPCSNASSCFSERDLSDQREIVSKLKSVHGNTQDMLNYISNNDNICIVAFDFAGPSTNVSDLKEFVRSHKGIKKVIIDHFFYENDFKTFERDQLLNEDEVIKLFSCRKPCKQRSK